DSERFGPRGDAAGNTHLLGGGLRYAIIFNDEKNRAPPQRGQVEAFVNRPFSHRPVAEEDGGNGARVTIRIGSTYSQGHQPALNTARKEVSMRQMLASSPAAAHPRVTSEDLGEQSEGVPAISEE